MSVFAFWFLCGLLETISEAFRLEFARNPTVFTIWALRISVVASAKSALPFGWFVLRTNQCQPR